MSRAAESSDWSDLSRRLDELCAALQRVEVATRGARAASEDRASQQLERLAAAVDAVQARLGSEDSADRWDQMNRRIDELFGLLNSLRGSLPETEKASAGDFSDRGLFVIGHARSGTTVLADALNTSDEVCCLMEPYFYRSFDLANFADSFNPMHRGFGNPPTKGYWVPGCGGASAREVVEQLRRTYRYVGEKLAFRQRNKDYDPDRFLEFALAEFARSPFICVIRDPVKVTTSAIDLFEGSDFNATTIASLVRSQLETYLMILRLCSLVPSFYLLVHEQVDRHVLAELGAALAINLERAPGVYLADFRRTPHVEETERVLRKDPGVQSLQEVYAAVQRLVTPKSVRVHTEKYGECRRLAERITNLLNPAAAGTRSNAID